MLNHMSSSEYNNINIYSYKSAGYPEIIGVANRF